MIYLDTSFLIRALVKRSIEDHRMRQWLEQGETLAMNAIAWSEFLCGPLQDSDRALATQVVVERTAFTSEDAEIAARLFNATARKRGTLMDCMIAATAIRVKAYLATANTADFQRFVAAGLQIIES